MPSKIYIMTRQVGTFGVPEVGVVAAFSSVSNAKAWLPDLEWSGHGDYWTTGYSPKTGRMYIISAYNFDPEREDAK